MRILSGTDKELKGTVSPFPGIEANFNAGIDGFLELRFALPESGQISLGGTEWQFVYKNGEMVMTTVTKGGFSVLNPIHALEGNTTTAVTVAAPATAAPSKPKKAAAKEPAPVASPTPLPDPAPVLGPADPMPAAAGRQMLMAVTSNPDGSLTPVTATAPVVTPPADEPPLPQPKPAASLGPAAPAAKPTAQPKPPAPAPATAVQAFGEGYASDLPKEVFDMMSAGVQGTKIILFLLQFAYDAVLAGVEAQGAEAVEAFFDVAGSAHREAVAKWIWSRIEPLPLFQQPMSADAPNIKWSDKVVIATINTKLNETHKLKVEARPPAV